MCSQRILIRTSVSIKALNYISRLYIPDIDLIVFTPADDKFSPVIEEKACGNAVGSVNVTHIRFRTPRSGTIP